MLKQIPTPLAFARLMDELNDPTGACLDAAQEALHIRLLQRPKLYRILHARLLRLAADAGITSHAWDFLAAAAESSEGLNWLLIARGWWQPAEVLDPLGDRGVDHQQILNILEARLRRGEGDAQRLLLVRRRLQAAVQQDLAAVQAADANARADTKTISPDAAKGAASPAAGLGSGEARPPAALRQPSIGKKGKDET